MVKKHLNLIVIGYITFLLLGMFYVDNVLKHTPVGEKSEKVENSGVKISPVNVYLEVEGAETYKSRLENQDSVGDFLDRLRDDEEVFFEKTMYIYGIDIEEVNHTIVPEGYAWKVFLGDQDITYSIDEIKLVDNTTYTLKVVRD